MSVLRNFGWMVASRGVGAVLSLAYLAITTRLLGSTGFGRFVLITGASLVLANLLAFQTSQIIVQYGIGHVEGGHEARLGRLYRAAIGLDIIGAIAGIGASLVILTFFAGALGIKDTLSRATLIFNAVMLLAAYSTPTGILRVNDRFELAAAAESAQPIFRFVGAVLVGLIHPTVQGFLVAWAVAEVLTFAAFWYAVFRIGQLRVLLTRGQNPRAVLADNPGIVRYALTSNFSQSLVTSTRQLPVLLVGGLTGVAAAGAFRLAAQLSRSLTLLAQLIARAGFPEMVRAARNLGVRGIGAMVLRTLRLSLGFSAILFTIALVFGRAILELIGGHDFGGAYGSLLWLAGAGCIDVMAVAFEPSLAAANHAHLGFLARLASTGVLVGGALVLQPSMGAEGIAAAVCLTALTQAALLGLMLVWVVRAGGAELTFDAERPG